MSYRIVLPTVLSILFLAANSTPVNARTGADTLPVQVATATDCYTNGMFLYMNESKRAFDVFRKGASNIPICAAMMARLLQRGRGGVKKNTQEAQRLAAANAANVKELAESGDIDAQIVWGVMLRAGLGVETNWPDAVKWTRLAAERGQVYAQGDLAWMYGRGRGVPKDDVEAAKWIHLAAEQGLITAQCSLGSNYLWGIGVSQDKAEAAKWYRRGAEQGNANCQAALGEMYIYGEGVPEDYAAALEWIRFAADQDDVKGLFLLGYMYAEGKGVLSDDKKAVNLIRQAAKRDYSRAQVALGDFFDAGRGVPEDPAEAVRWYRLAAEKEYSDAQYRLAKMYAAGRGVTQDYAQALELYRLAAKQGHSMAEEKADEIETAVALDMVEKAFFLPDVESYGNLIEKSGEKCGGTEPTRAQFDACFGYYWDFFDLSNDGSLSLAEISRVVRIVTKWAGHRDERLKPDDKAKMVGILMLVSSTVVTPFLKGYDYDNNDLLSKEEFLEGTRFEAMLALDSSTINSALANRKLRDTFVDTFSILDMLKYRMP